MEEWQVAGSRVSKYHRVLTATGCSVSGETKRNYGANAQQARLRRDPSMYVNRRRATMKGCVREVHFR
jgi:hypothetical protein